MPEQTPSLGRIVLVRWPDGDPIGHPAIITNVHSPTMINARVFLDNAENPLWATSVPYEDENAAYGGPTWRWPPRV